MDHVFLVKNNILSLVQEKHKTKPQVEGAASEIKSLELVTIADQPSKEENILTSSPTPEQMSSPTASSDKNKAVEGLVGPDTAPSSTLSCNIGVESKITYLQPNMTDVNYSTNKYLHMEVV